MKEIEQCTSYHDLHYGFNEGAKWQAKRMYSEEDLREAWENGWEKGRNGETKMTSSHPKWFEQIMLRNRTFTKWFEQFKKK